MSYFVALRRAEALVKNPGQAACSSLTRASCRGRELGPGQGYQGRRKVSQTRLTWAGGRGPDPRTLGWGGSVWPRACELSTRSPVSPALSRASLLASRCLNPGQRRPDFGRKKNDFGKRKGEGASPPRSSKSMRGSFSLRSC